MKILLRNVRLAFPQLYVAAGIQGQEDSAKAYSCTFLLPADHPQVAEIEKIIDAVATEKWANKAPAILKQLRSLDKVLLHNGDNKADYDGFPGNWYISARSPTKPLVIDRNRQILTQESGLPYGGCYVNGTVEAWAQDNQWGKRVNATLKGVQFLRDGDAFGAGPPASPDDFPDEELSDTGQAAEPQPDRPVGLRPRSLA